MKNKVLVFFVDGFEPIEALTCVDLLRRAEICVDMVSLTGNKTVFGSCGVNVESDIKFADVVADDYSMVVMPGGPGTDNYLNYPDFLEFLIQWNEKKKLIGAICAAPKILAEIGILDGVTAVCYPSVEADMSNAIIGNGIVEVDKNIITSKGPATSIAFALKLIEILLNKDVMKKIESDILYNII